MANYRKEIFKQLPKLQLIDQQDSQGKNYTDDSNTSEDELNLDIDSEEETN